MGKKDEINKKYWKEIIESQLREEYNEYLTREGKERGPDSAHLFAREISGRYAKYSERQIILLLVGKLPYMYD